MQLPQIIDLTPENEIVIRANYGTINYINNIEYNLQINFIGDYISIDYYGEDGTFLSDIHEDFIQKILALN